MKLFGKVTFDFDNNQVRLGRTWIKGAHVKFKEKVRLIQDTVIPARSEQVVTVRCTGHCSLMEADFEPRRLSVAPGLQVSKARVIPNVNGVFLVTVLNTNKSDSVLNNRCIMGHLQEQVGVLACVDANEKVFNDL